MLAQSKETYSREDGYQETNYLPSTFFLTIKIVFIRATQQKDIWSESQHTSSTTATANSS
jgi:hypothetical protein